MVPMFKLWYIQSRQTWVICVCKLQGCIYIWMRLLINMTHPTLTNTLSFLMQIFNLPFTIFETYFLPVKIRPLKFYHSDFVAHFLNMFATCLGQFRVCFSGFNLWTSAHGFHHLSLTQSKGWRIFWGFIIFVLCISAIACIIYYFYFVFSFAIYSRYS